MCTPAPIGANTSFPAVDTAAADPESAQELIRHHAEGARAWFKTQPTETSPPVRVDLLAVSSKVHAFTGTSHLDDRSGPGPEIMAASDFEGEDVMNRQGETLGDIEEIMLDVRSGRIAYAV